MGGARLDRREGVPQRSMTARSAIPTGFGARSAGASIGSSPTRGSRTPRSIPRNVSIKWFEDGTLNVARQLHRPPSGDARRSGRHHLGRRRSRRSDEKITYRQLHERVCKLRQRPEGARRQEGRPRHDLSADDPGGRLRHARLRAHRRHAFGRVRRLLARQPRRPHRGRGVEVHHHRRRRPARRQARAAQEERRRGACRRWQGRREGAGRAPHRQSRAVDAGPRSLAARGAGEGLGRLPAGRDERRGSAVHPLHVGLDGKAQGRAAHLRRLSRVTPP